MKTTMIQIKKITAEYDKYSNTSDIVNSPVLFEKALSSKSKWFTNLVKNENKRVQRALADQLNLKRNSVLGDLITQVSTNSADKFLFNLDSRVNLSIANMLSGNQTVMAIGETDFNSILNSKIYENLEPAIKNVDYLIATTSRFRNKNLKHIKLEA